MKYYIKPTERQHPITDVVSTVYEVYEEREVYGLETSQHGITIPCVDVKVEVIGFYDTLEEAEDVIKHYETNQL